ncbi:MAG: GMP reductase [Candidatus Izemoplasma sp.]|nr:GMP reductase [Candidatus Izemoplasma sp.]
MRMESDTKLDFKDVLIRPKRSNLSSRKEVSLKRTYTFKHSHKEWTGIPIMTANMDGVGTLEMANELQKRQLFTCLVKTYDEDDLKGFNVNPDYVAISTGISKRDYKKVQAIIQAHPELYFICIDVANGYSEKFGDFVEKVRTDFPHYTIIAGNVVTADMTQELILRGADIIKVGIGPGSVCTTRIQTGVGYPQLSAIMECADAAHGLGAHIIADGGCTSPGDIAKAFGAGADFVMLGGMFAGHDEGGGTIIEKVMQTKEVDPKTQQLKTETKKYVEFYGMSSDTAMDKHHGGVAEYRSSEGRTVRLPYRGNVDCTVKNILGGLRSTCTYVGAPTLKQLSKCTTFIRVTKQYNDVFEE